MTPPERDLVFDLVFRWKDSPNRARFFGQRCRILGIGRARLGVLVEFENGERHVTSIHALKRA